MFAIFVIRFFFSKEKQGNEVVFTYCGKEINKSGSKYNYSIPTCVWKC